MKLFLVGSTPTGHPNFMLKETYDCKLESYVKEEQAEPVCGDCLACYGDDECFRAPYHRWIVYVN